MNLVTFTYIEEYLEFIAGMKDITGKMTNSWYMPTAAISLARYDVGFITSVANQTVTNLGLSEKQAALALRLIRTYQRQLAKLGVGQPSFDNPQFRIPVRHLNYERTISVEQGMIYVRFPFDSALINEVKTSIKESRGSFAWSKDDKVWKLGLTEPNINWAVAFGTTNKFTLSQEVTDLFDLIIECEKTPYVIELRRNADGIYYVENAPESLTSYIEQNIGFTNRNKLVDMASVLGYTVSSEIYAEVACEYGVGFMSFCTARDTDYPPSKEDPTAALDKIIQWAIAVGRFPIIVYNPLDVISEGTFTWAEKYFTEEERTVIKNPSSPNVTVDSKVKIIYTNKVIRAPAKLLVSYTSMMFGQEKLEWVQSIEKVVRYCEKMR